MESRSVEEETMNDRGNVAGKLMTAGEAVREFVKDGCRLALGGFTISRSPMALTYEIVRRRVRHLHLVCHSNGQALDLLVGAGCVDRVEIAYGGNGRFAPTCMRFRKAVERGEIEVEDYSNNQMSLRFLAGALGVPFIPTRCGLATDIVRQTGFSAETRAAHGLPRQKLIVVDDPFDDGGDQVVLLPALTPDICLLHTQTVGDRGTVRIKGLTFADVEQAKAAGTLIVSCEEIVPEDELREDPDQNCLPGFMVDAVVLAPYGAHPTACPSFYDYDVKHLNAYKTVAKDDELFRQYLDEWVYGCADLEQYLLKVGAATLQTIKADPVSGYAPGMDRT